MAEALPVPPSEPAPTLGDDEIPEGIVTGAEWRWVAVVAGITAFMFAVMIYAGLHYAAAPPSNLETIEPTSLHRDGSEFVETNLGSAVQPDGTVVVRVVAQQYAFVPSVLTVPLDTPVLFRVTSPDVVHGFLVTGTNVNTMVVPGFVASVRARFARAGDYLMPCHEFCGPAHHDMWARVRVVPRAEFPFDPTGARRF